MKDEEIIMNCPLSVNIQRLEAYLLAPDEVILFDWLVIKQSAVFKYKWFYYSHERIKEETRIKRNCFERIIKRFCAMGILLTETRPKPNEQGRARFFRVEFAEISRKLNEIIDKNNAMHKTFKTYFAALARKQANADKGKGTETLKEICERNNADLLYNALVDVYRNRCEMYNDGKLTDDLPERTKTATQFPRNAAINRQLARLADTYDTNTAKMAFTAYCDDVLTGGVTPKNIIAYFLKYDEAEECFAVADEYLIKFQQNYSAKR